MSQESLYARNENYKAVIRSFEVGEKTQYEVCLYHWTELAESESENPLWERLAGPFILDTSDQAHLIAAEKLGVYSGEIPDESVEESLKKEVQSILGDRPFAFLKPNKYTIQQTAEGKKIKKATRLLSCEPLCFVLEGTVWHTGVLSGDQKIECFVTHPTLGEALKDLEE